MTRAHPKQPRREASNTVHAAFIADARGGGVLQLQYSGPLITYPEIWVHLGERRHGVDWIQTRDVRMEKTAAHATLQIAFAPGDPVEGATFAFFTTVGPGGQTIWDNAGRPFGCYVLDTSSGEIRTR